jgi:hypothetical protein
VDTGSGQESASKQKLTIPSSDFIRSGKTCHEAAAQHSCAGRSISELKSRQSPTEGFHEIGTSGFLCALLRSTLRVAGAAEQLAVQGAEPL